MATDPNDPTTTDDENQPVLDRVQEVSKKADGTPDQMDGFEVIPTDDDEAEEEPAPRRRGRPRKADVEEATER
jgi:hypothetical protein